MRRAARKDGNQDQVVAGFRACGYSVWITHQLGTGVDIVVGGHGRNWLFEIKDPAQPPSKRHLTDDEETFHRAWRGQADVIETLQDGLDIIRRDIRAAA